MKVLIANRGEIALRLISACRTLHHRTLAIYAAEDGDSLHVRLADEAVALHSPTPAGSSAAYLDAEQIVRICREKNVDAVLPGYGFLSENAAFAEMLRVAGVVFGGPSAEVLRDFGLKHRARELAVAAGVPVVPGTKGVVRDGKEAVREARRLGFPVMVKATAGGGGMGLKVCYGEEEVRVAVESVSKRGEVMFKDAGVFLERFVESGRHVEGQVFGNGEGEVLWFGERECSVQRRHQKVLEEAPSPFVLKHPGLRERLRVAAVALARSVNYKSVGTVEFLVDDKTGEFYFLEMNTRLQVEHGVTELCYEVDLVELMLKQAEAEVQSLPGLSHDELARYTRAEPKCHAVEVRVYAENPADGYKPSPGLFTDVSFPQGEHIRVDTWLERGSTVTASFDPLLAKVMVRAGDRDSAFDKLQQALADTKLYGPPTNLEFLEAIVRDPAVRAGRTLTSTLNHFRYTPSAIEVKDGGLYTTVQDYPGRPNYRSGVPVSGPMDGLSLRIANLIVGNADGTESLEITYGGPRMLFHQAAVVALCGAQFDFSINGEAVALWSRHLVPAGAEVVVGGNTSGGCRAYLAILGGFPNVGAYLGSRSTTPSLKWGGYQGRTLRAGDWLQISSLDPDASQITGPFTLPLALIPPIASTSPIYTLPGPYDTSDFITPQGRHAFFDTAWKVAFSSSRGGIRLEGPPPQWSRLSGGEGGSHPSNMLGYGYPLGGMSFTGDEAVVFTMDSPVQSGFICPQTVLSCQMWRLGQLKPGDCVRFAQCSWEQAMELEKSQEEFVRKVAVAVTAGETNGAANVATSWEISRPVPESSVLYERVEQSGNGLPRLVLRQAGDRGILCDFGSQVFDLTVRTRAQQLVRAVGERPPRGFQRVTRPHTMSVFVAFDSHIIDQKTAVDALVNLERSFSDVSNFTTPSKTFHLPMVFDAEECVQATARYMETQRPYATYLPDNIDFIRRNNGLEKRDDVLKAVNGVPFLVVASSGIMGLPILMPIDPRKRLTVPKTNPSRTVTPAGALGTGGNTSSIYPVDSPGGYLLWGMTLPGCPFDTFGRKPNYTPDAPWLYNTFDQVVFHAVSRAEFDAINQRFQMGLYEIKVEDSVFEMKKYIQLTRDTAEEVARIGQRQRECAAIELEKENELLQRWKAEKQARGDQGVEKQQDKDAALLESNANATRVLATMSARVWKQVASNGSMVKSGEDLLVLEAMKMEIAVKAPGDGPKYSVVAVLKQKGDLVEPGDVLVLLVPS
ncbi:urea carboxylase [Cyphellophora europaea CBS 101466]|uniref:Urea carboxylase n=1 Tax=Cyphellophora europaea (strain CBS 101466) TaxID=1220924 RepID=W2S5Q1_CYPE1|nr:urea carboxylase [Cyphellophora europaea CBS 101466]ETN43925.1 urea carboxylase [Cyphellophora europaea CBS 101466]